MLIGALFGGVLGVAAALLLVASLDPPRWMERVSDPVALWYETTDPTVLGAAAAVVAGCALIGALFPLRRG
jgi:hypothetical protein